MRTRTSSSRVLTCCLAVGVLIVGARLAAAGTPQLAEYCPAGHAVFWFVQVSDPHIGARGTDDANRLRWIVTTGRQVIGPSFIVATGDLTDSTGGNIFGYPNGPYQAEWDEYKSIVDGAGVGATNYFDVPGNHDAYNDQYFAYYRANSVQGRATGGTQLSWTLSLPYGTYHFLGVNTADNTGDPFSLLFPYGDRAGLDVAERSFIDQRLSEQANAHLTFVFGHHPVTDTGESGDTWLFYGHKEFVYSLDTWAASVYGYGHTHATSEVLFRGDTYTDLMAGPGIHYDNISSLGKSTSNHYMLYAVDCDGVSAVPATVGTWPVVLITSPVNALIGGAANPYAYEVPASATNWVRALVFDAGTVGGVSFRIDGGTTWFPMTRVDGSAALWQGTWNASMLPAGPHTIEVRAVGTTTRSDTITVHVAAGLPDNHPPVAVDDAYSTRQGVTLTVQPPAGVLQNDSDPDGDAITAAVLTPPAHGSFTFNPDGSFTYTPDAAFTGEDGFTYVARDAAANSSPAQVRLRVDPAPPVTDTVRIVTATYTRKTRVLKVEATSSGAPGAVLHFHVDDAATEYPMTYSAKTNKYSGQRKLTTSPLAVRVDSSLLGTATLDVTIK